MSPWTVYWVMQADSLRGALVTPIVLSIVGALISGFVASMTVIDPLPDRGRNDRIHAKSRFWLSFSVTVFAIAGTAISFVPTTKTLCAVIAVPAVINNEQLQADAADIYRLGMERLKEELGAEKPSDE